MKKLIALVLFGMIAGVVGAGTIAVSGSGMASARPDCADITLTISAQDQSFANVIEMTRANSAEIIKVMQSVGVTEDEMSLSDAVLTKEEHWEDDLGCRVSDYSERAKERVFDGYRQTFTLNLDIPLDMARIENIYLAVMKAELVDSFKVYFYLKNADELRFEARRRAIENARKTAVHACEVAGVTLGEIREINCGARMYDRAVATDVVACAAMDDDNHNPIFPTIKVVDVSVSDEVSIDWEIK